MMKQGITYGLVFCVMVLMGCETTKGIGQDMENTGKNIKETVKKND